MEKTEEVKAQYGRVKGAEWFPLLHKRSVLVLGQGGIGSWVTLLLGRIGCDLTIADMDIYEEHNMTGQFVGKSGIGKAKTDAMVDVMRDFSPDCGIDTIGRYGPESPVNDITICGFDNMTARRIAFENWKGMVQKLHNEDKKTCFFQDGRLLAEQLQIISIPGNRTDLMDKYEKEYLFDDSVVQEAECTFKQTSHCAAMIASKMVGFLTNWAINAKEGIPIRQVPFFYEYLIPLNLVTC